MALANTPWYVDGSTRQPITTACRPRTHVRLFTMRSHSLRRAIPSGLLLPIQSISAPVFNLTIRGSNAQTTIINAGAANTVVTIRNSAVRVSLANMTIRNGVSNLGGGINNGGILTITHSANSGNNACNEGGGVYNAGTLMISP